MYCVGCQAKNRTHLLYKMSLNVSVCVCGGGSTEHACMFSFLSVLQCDFVCFYLSSLCVVVVVFNQQIFGCHWMCLKMNIRDSIVYDL